MNIRGPTSGTVWHSRLVSYRTGVKCGVNAALYLISSKRALTWACCGLLAAWLCNPAAATSGEKTVYWTTNSADAAACQGQLNMIFGALQEYQKRNQNLPRWLSDLVPDYIHDRNTLVCPYVLKTGNLKKFREKYFLGRVFKDPGSCSYGYEFCTESWEVPGWTTRIYKERQMELIGFNVPIVRCFAHRPVLNLAFDGSLYPSTPEWEDTFVRSSKQNAVLHNIFLLTNISENKLVSKLSEPRKPETNAGLLDLSTQCNASLLHLSQIDQSGKLLIPYPEGVRQIAGVQFDVRAIVHLGARQFPILLPEKIENIPVNRKCRAIHFLHGATFPASNGSKVASFVIHFREGGLAEMPIIYGRDVKTRWFNQNQKSELEPPKPAWISSPDRVGANGKSLRLYMSSWRKQNADPDVTTIDFISHMTESAPFLLAITIE